MAEERIAGEDAEGSMEERANAHEKQFNWMKAAHVYDSWLRVHHKHQSQPDILERLASAYFLAAMQAKDNKTFRVRTAKAVTSNRAACTGFQKASRKAAALRSEGMDAYLRSWLSSKPGLKKHLLDRAWRFAKRSMTASEKIGDTTGMAKTFAALSVAPSVAFQYDWNPTSRASKLKDAIAYGRRAMENFPADGSKALLASVCVRTALLIDKSFDEGCFEGAARTGMESDAREFWAKGLEMDSRVAVLEVMRPPSWFHEILDQAQSVNIQHEAELIAMTTRDNFLIGCVFDEEAGREFWRAEGTENSQEKAKIGKEALRLAELARVHFEVIGHTVPIGGVCWPHSPYAEHFWQLSSCEDDPDKRRRLKEKSWQESKLLGKLAKRTGIPGVIAYSGHVAGRTAWELSNMEKRSRIRRNLLRESLRFRAMSVQINDRVLPSWHWNRGMGMKYLSSLKETLAELETRPSVKKKLLLQSVEDRRKGLALCANFVESIAQGQPHILRPAVARYEGEYGDLLNVLYSATGDEEALRNAAHAYTEAARTSDSSQMFSRAGLWWWKGGQTFSNLRSHAIAADYYDLASKAYDAAISSTIQLKDLYHEYGQYLTAWGRIERARENHQKMDYAEASRLYEEASKLHLSTVHWSFLAPYYNALARLEHAEDLSMKGLSVEAASVFASAAELFRNTRPYIHNHLALIDRPEEKEMVERLRESPNAEYCSARVLIEEARLADSQGDCNTSMEKFGLAAEMLEKTSKRTLPSQDSHDLSFLSSLSKAWHLMAKATVENDSALMSTASDVLENATRSIHDGNTRALAKGYSRYFLGVKEGNLFAESLDPDQYKAAVNHFNASMEHLSNSHHSIQYEQVRASKLLIEAQAQRVSGDSEPNQEAKASHYKLSSELLRESALEFEKAGRPSQKVQVLNLISRLESELSLTARLADIVRITSAMSLSVPAISHEEERAVGSRRFDGPDIETRMTVSSEPDGPDPTRLGVTMEILNTGTQVVTISKVDEAVPDGTRLLEAPEESRIVGRSVVLRRNKIRPSMPQTVKFSLGLNAKESVVLLGPKVHFVDENGTEHSRGVLPRVAASTSMLDLLTVAFEEDFRQKRLALDQCGWRTLMNIVNSLHIPRSHVYGEPRYGRRYGKQLASLVSSGLVEVRIFLRERGRGGEIEKARINFDSPIVRRLLAERENK